MSNQDLLTLDLSNISPVLKRNILDYIKSHCWSNASEIERGLLNWNDTTGLAGQDMKRWAENANKVANSIRDYNYPTFNSFSRERNYDNLEVKIKL